MEQVIIANYKYSEPKKELSRKLKSGSVCCRYLIFLYTALLISSSL